MPCHKCQSVFFRDHPDYYGCVICGSVVLKRVSAPTEREERRYTPETKTVAYYEINKWYESIRVQLYRGASWDQAARHLREISGHFITAPTLQKYFNIIKEIKRENDAATI